MHQPPNLPTFFPHGGGEGKLSIGSCWLMVVLTDVAPLVDAPHGGAGKANGGCNRKLPTRTTLMVVKANCLLVVVGSWWFQLMLHHW